MSTKKVCIIGSGRQGTAAAFDLVKFCNNIDLTFLDINSKQSAASSDRIFSLLKYRAKHVSFNICDKEKLITFLAPYDIFLSSVPYKLNPYLTDVAIKSKTSMVDLGGHTLNVKKQLLKNKEAQNANITIVPDCGMGPGMNVSVAMLGIESMDSPKEVYVWDGGLPQNPKPPWNYSLFFNIQGLTNEYDGMAYFIENKKVVEVPCFEYLENIRFDNIGELEAAVTSGGLSTMPWTYEGKLDVLHNKTLRYKGHWSQMKAFRELGLFQEKEIDFKETKVSPREFYHHLLSPKLTTSLNKDICLMRVMVKGSHENREKTTIVDIEEMYDEETGFLAMEKWTGWHASIVMIEIMNKNIGSGAIPIEKALSGNIFYKRALDRSYNIKIKNI
ncbi:MAG: hypothetical protein CMG00_07970 [Candidatus Marinimicrobia bacterium]|nr:hypothetical protein [Candidatus Neomarinimicrobiota bacterium]|tara:strand:+ start:1909 stop:3069 length:1161 start_codon:yes stop_codon:yes gene_type:complete